MSETGALDVYFEDEIQILVADPSGFRADRIGPVLEANEIAYSRISSDAR